MRLLYVIYIFPLFFNCYSGENQKNILTKNQALKLAVKISNEKCKENFDVTPFDTGSYSIEYIDGYWIWGEFDVRGINGYSVVTKFDKYGKKDTVEVYFSEDYLDHIEPAK
jgi:hypothetical protein